MAAALMQSRLLELFLKQVLHAQLNTIGSRSRRYIDIRLSNQVSVKCSQGVSRYTCSYGYQPQGVVYNNLFAYPPVVVQQVQEINHRSGELQGIPVFADIGKQILLEIEIHPVVERITGGISF